MYYPSLLAASAILLWIAPTNLVTGISSAIAAIIGCLMMWEFLFLNRVIRLSVLCAMGLVIGYGAGTLNSWMTLTQGPIPLASAAGQTVPELANGVAAALMGCAVLLFLGELLETPVVTIDEQLSITRGVKYVIFVNFAIIVIATAIGDFHQGGIRAAGSHHAGVLEVFLSFLLSPTVVLATIALLIEEENAQRYLLGGITVFLWLLQVTQGRRDLVYPALVTIGLARYFGYKWGRFGWRRIVLLAAGIVFLFFGVLTYQLMRLAGSASPQHSIVAEGQKVGEWLQQGRAWKIATASSVQNVKGRTLIVPFLSDMLYRERTASPAYGKDLLLQLEVSIPSVIFRNKPDIVEETLASRTFGVFYPDESNSLFTAGALDFGIWGVLIYPIVTLLLFSTFLRFIKGQFSYEVFIFVSILFIDTAIAAETQQNAYFGVMRDSFIFAGFLYLISRLPIFRWERSN